MSYTVQRLLALVGLIALAPLMAVLAIAIRLVDGGPVLFRQQRVGRSREPFMILKFRTMRVDADELLGADGVAQPRITRTGKWLRRSSLDELPQLLNILRGDMAIIGPRALLPEVAVNVPPQFDPRYDVLPGITGLAQVSGRNHLPWSRRLQLDVEYSDRRSVAFDCRLIVKTLIVVLRGTGYSPDRTTAATDDLGLLGQRPTRPGNDE